MNEYCAKGPPTVIGFTCIVNWDNAFSEIMINLIQSLIYFHIFTSPSFVYARWNFRLVLRGENHILYSFIKGSEHKKIYKGFRFVTLMHIITKPFRFNLPHLEKLPLRILNSCIQLGLPYYLNHYLPAGLSLSIQERAALVLT